ncbi:hypothetical protein TM239_21980 [Bradyrhizobium sp. TM239]|nr:hypothetical protein TM239_21980 [Bradyrhizobium sp. TM239]
MIGTTCMLLCGFLRVHFAQQTAGASRHPAFPAPSWIGGWSDEAKLGRIEPRECEGVSASRAACHKLDIVGWAKRKRAHALLLMERDRGHGAVRLCPPDGTALGCALAHCNDGAPQS